MSKKKFKRKEAAFTQIYPQFAESVRGDENHRIITKSKIIRVKKKSVILVDEEGIAIGHFEKQENGKYQFTTSGTVVFTLNGERKAREVPARRPRQPRSSFSTDKPAGKEQPSETVPTSSEHNQQVS